MPGALTAMAVLHGGCAALYLVLSALVLVQGRLSLTGRLFAAAALVTAVWAATVAAFGHSPVNLAASTLDVVRGMAWCGFILHLYLRTAQGSSQQRGQAFLMMGLIAVLVVAVTVLLGRALPGGAVTIWSGEVVARLGVAVCSVLLIENLYLNTPPDARWHISLPCIALGALAGYDIALSADALLFRRLSLELYDGRAIATAIVAPLLAVAAARNRSDWGVDIHVSRTAVFHSATLVVSGIFLLGLVIAGETLRYIGADWGGVAEISLIFAGLVTLAVLLASRSVRSRLRALLVDHFFSHRYDYRREWMRCIATLSSPDAYIALHTRVIRAMAEVVDSPGGVLLLREPGDGAFQWAGSWNMPTAAAIMPDHPLVPAFRDGDWIVEAEPFEIGIPGAWLAVPLTHNGRLIGMIVVARPRAEFKLDREVFELLRIIGRQVATYVAEQRATEGLMQARQLHEYGKRFAFVAHDIKNVSSQLSLLLSNAETYLENPEFQRDMLATIRAAVAKIGALIRRLEVPDGELGQTVLMPAERLEAIVASSRRLRGAAIEFTEDGAAAGVAMAAAAFDAVITHLLDNAIEAARMAAAAAGREPEPVRIALSHAARRALIDIVDAGPGMTPEFVRDELFRPFRTSKPEGSGIGAYQARELVRGAGGDLLVLSRPGAGTTMRLLLPLVEAATRQPAAIA
jgi:putative PEP-CTERM system histidine kinase